MAMHVPKAPGFTSMMKDGVKHLSGLEEAVYKNIDACDELAKTTKSTYGPNGQNKMVINHIEKLFVTSDAATILRELEVQHPAAKMLVMASQQQEQECGDGTNFVIVFAGALLSKAQDLLKMGLSVVEVKEGYEMACSKALDTLPDLVVDTVKELHDRKSLVRAIKTPIMSKQYGNEEFLAELIADACTSIYAHDNYFNVDNIRVSKILGAGVQSSCIVNGMVFKKFVEGDFNSAENCHVAVFSCPLDLTQTETKGTVLIKTATELMDYSKGEEGQVEEHIKGIAESGCKVIVSGGKIGEMYLHYANKYQLVVVRLNSKFDLRRLCRSIGATALPRIVTPNKKEMGFCDKVFVKEIGDTSVVVFQEKKDTSVATIVIRGSTDNIMDDIERAIDDGVNTFKVLTKDNRMLPGAGAVEMELAKVLTSYSETTPGLEQYAIQKFAEAFEELPRALAENTGVKGTEVISQLYAAHQEGNKNAGFNIVDEEVSIYKDVTEQGIFDMYSTKYWGIKFATSAANTVLNVDQIIMSKQAGGPKARAPQGGDADDD